jgi:hypothetical protein
VSIGLACQHFFGVEAMAVIATDHTELSLLIVELHNDPRCP